MARGASAEDRLKRIYEAAGWKVIRKPNTSSQIDGKWINTSRDFFGRFDLMCLSPFNQSPHLIQVTVAEASASRHRTAIHKWTESRMWGANLLVMWWRGPGERPNPNCWYVYRLTTPCQEESDPGRLGSWPLVSLPPALKARRSNS
jgi:hypothetical protein